jgi:hypothetical protein
MEGYKSAIPVLITPDGKNIRFLGVHNPYPIGITCQIVGTKNDGTLLHPIGYAATFGSTFWTGVTCNLYIASGDILPINGRWIGGGITQTTLTVLT